MSYIQFFELLKNVNYLGRFHTSPDHRCTSWKERTKWRWRAQHHKLTYVIVIRCYFSWGRIDHDPTTSVISWYLLRFAVPQKPFLVFNFLQIAPSVLDGPKNLSSAESGTSARYREKMLKMKLDQEHRKSLHESTVLTRALKAAVQEKEKAIVSSKYLFRNYIPFSIKISTQGGHAVPVWAFGFIRFPVANSHLDQKRRILRRL